MAAQVARFRAACETLLAEPPLRQTRLHTMPGKTPLPVMPARQLQPSIPLVALDYLWFQVAGTVCNLRCAHCFISCAPDNHNFWFLDLETVRNYLEQSKAWGVREYYFTGGEPFMNRDLLSMLEAALLLGPASVLTNGTLLPEKTVRRLAEIDASSRFSLELRVSIDGPTAESNDAIRGRGCFDRAMEGIQRLLAHGLMPILTAAQLWDPARDLEVLDQFTDALRKVGYDRPRIKILPTLRLGREAARTRGYSDGELVTRAMMEGYEVTQLLCSSGRVVSDRGVHVCPILLEEPDALLGATLEEADRPHTLSSRACYTCWLHGAICTNYGGIGREL